MTPPKVFVVSDQNHFAALSGDANPIHLDPIAARRTQAGAPVVHGIHAALWALEALAEDGQLAGPIASLYVRFQKFIYVGAAVELRIASSTATSLRAELVSEGITPIVLDISYGTQEPSNDPNLSSEPVDSSQPAELDISSIRGLAGTLQITEAGSVANMFPHAAKAFGSERLAAITRLSALVGMVCPGLHSIFSGFAVRMVRESNPGLSFRVRNVDERFRLVEIAVAGGGIAGEVTAFLRQPPVEQASAEELRSLVEPGEFVHAKALVVGGSRGLGALTAKIIAAGGGRVTATYASGKNDALAIAREIGRETVTTLHYDVRRNAEQQIAALSDVNQLYYFATPHIFRQKGGRHSRERLAEFTAYYVDGFAALCSALRDRLGHGFAAFYPSSMAVEKPPRDMAEYAMAKAAGEALCADMNVSGEIRVVVKRLPRLLTDQTATVMPIEHVDAVREMLAIVREMCAIS